MTDLMDMLKKSGLSLCDWPVLVSGNRHRGIESSMHEAVERARQKFNKDCQIILVLLPTTGATKPFAVMFVSVLFFFVFVASFHRCCFGFGGCHISEAWDDAAVWFHSN